MFKKNFVLNFLFFTFICSFAAEEYNKKFTYFNSLYSLNLFTNGAIGLSLAFLSFKLLNKKKPPSLKSFPYLQEVSYGVSIIFPFLINAWRAKKLYKLYNKLSCDYIIKHFDSVKSHDYWFDKSVMIDDLKMNLLEKSGFGKESISYQKYNVLLDILTKSPKKIIDELKEYDEQENFLSTVLLLDAEKVRDLKFVYLTNIKEAFKETSKLEKKFSDSLFFNTSETINHFLNKVHPPIGAQFIVEYKDDIKNLVDYLIPIGDKIKSIFSAEWKSENEPKSKELKSEKIGETKNKKGTIISENILFDLIINAFSKNKELALLWVNYLSDECFFNLITFIYLNPFTIDNRKQATFFMLIQDFYNSYKILFIKKSELLKKNKYILTWWLGKAGYKRTQQPNNRSKL